MWMMLQQEQPDDYVIATGESHSVREFLEEAFGYLGLDYHQFVVEDPRLYRPAEVRVLEGDPSKAKRVLGWRYRKTFAALVHEMVEADLGYAESNRSFHLQSRL
jgi:GDPmannose 4,6-dehydratase